MGWGGTGAGLRTKDRLGLGLATPSRNGSRNGRDWEVGLGFNCAISEVGLGRVHLPTIWEQVWSASDRSGSPRHDTREPRFHRHLGEEEGRKR